MTPAGIRERGQGLGRRGLGLETCLEPKVRVFYIYFFYTNCFCSSILLTMATWMTTTAGIRETREVFTLPPGIPGNP
jgi:hypothetical protein